MTSVVYFIENDGLVKIGFTKNLRQRIAHIPGRVLGYLPGGRTEEAAFHAQFAALRAHGEWFRHEPPLTEFLSSFPPCDIPRYPRGCQGWPRGYPRKQRSPDTDRLVADVIAEHRLLRECAVARAAAIADALNKGATLRELGKVLGVSPETVRKWGEPT